MGYDLISASKKKNTGNKYDLMQYVERDVPPSPPGTLTSQPIATPFKSIPAHTPYQAPQPLKGPSSTWDKVKAGDLKGLGKEIGLGLSYGLSHTGTAQMDKLIANDNVDTQGPLRSFYQNQLSNQQRQEEYLKANPINSLPAMLGAEIPKIPLWMAGERGVGFAVKGLTKLVPSLSKVSKLPSIVKGGLTDAGAYGAVVAPTEAFANSKREGDTGGTFTEQLWEKEKQLPMVLGGGIATRGLFKGVGESARLARDVAGEGGSLKQALALRKIQPPSVPSANPLADVQAAYKKPSLKDARLAKPVTRNVQRGAELGPLKSKERITPAYKAKQAELTETFMREPLVDTPLATRTLQENIDSRLGIGKAGPTDYNASEIFGKPLNIFKKSTDAQDAVAEITSKMTKQANDVTKTLRQMDSETPIATVRSQIQKMGGIKPSKGDLFEEQQVIPSWIKNEKGRPFDEVADTLGMSSEELRAVISSEAFKPKNYAEEAFKVLRNDPEYQAWGKTLQMLKSELPGKGKIQGARSDIKLKPRELTPKPEVLPIQSQRKTLSGSLPVDVPLARPVKKLTPVAKERLFWTNREGIPIGEKPINSPAPIKAANPIPKDGNIFWKSVNKELYAKGQQPPFSIELMKKDILEGKLDISKLSNEEDIRRMLGMNLQKFANAPEVAQRAAMSTNVDGTLQGGLLRGTGQVRPMESRVADTITGPNAPIKPRSVKDIADPNIPAGKVERGFSENTRTDINNPDALRDSYTENPLSYEQLGNKETLAKAEEIFNLEHEAAMTQLRDLASRMQPEAIPLAKMLSRQATEAGNIQGAREIISEVAEKLTQAGQFGQAAKILRDSDPETFLMTIGKQLKKLNKEGLEQYGKKWNNVDLTPDELTMVGRIERGNQSSYEVAFEQIQARIANEMPSSAFEKINAWRHMAMLLNPKTHIRNVGGNAIQMALRKSAQRVSGVLQKVILPKSDRTQSVFVNKEFRNLADDYFEANKKDLLSGANKYQEGVSLRMPDKRVFRKSRIGEKLGMDIDILEKTRKFNYALLQKGDNPFYKRAYADRLASYAQSKGIKDFSQLKQEAFDIARLEAEQATYKDASSIADFINKHKRPPKDANIVKKGGAILLEAALPFTKTPINIVKRGLQYSPLGVASGFSGLKSSKGAAIAIDELAKGLTGTGVLGLGYLLASKGILTGKAEKDVDLKAYNSNTGHSPFSILGKYSYDWAQPFSIPLSVGVEIYNSLKDNPKDLAKMDSVIAQNDVGKLEKMATGAVNAITEGMNASGDTVFNMSLLRSVKQLFGGQMGFMEGMAQLPQNYATQFFPTALNQAAGAIDPIARQTYVKGDKLETFKNTIQSRIPIANKSLQPKQTPFGEDMKKIENPIGRAMSQFLSPGIIAKNQNIDPKIDSELRRLNEFGLINQFPTMVPNYIEKTQTHPKIMLTPEETTFYQKRVGKLTLNSFQKVMSSNSYLNPKKTKLKSPDEVKAGLLADAISDAKALAKKEILQSKGLK